MTLFRKKNLDELEAVLSRAREANALVLAEKGAGGMELVYELWKKMRDGEILALLHKRMIVFDSNALIAAAKQKAVFEEMLLKVLNDAASAGNVVLVFDDLPSFVMSARALGSELESLIDPFLAGSQLQVIALSDPTNFHASIETSRAFTGRFEKVQVEEADAGSLLAVLQHQALVIESREKIFFTFQSLLTIVEDARRYFSDDISLDKVIDLLEEVVPHAKQQGVATITKELVQSVVQNETGIPIGEISKDEREKLLHLEDHLHERVIGQDLAIRAIANALRRARGGVGNPKRPMGSFLFLGPTGVGKTEAAKALAHIFFGNEDMMMRLDMSEYKGVDATDKLIGSFEGGKVGVLSALLRERPYGVLLLDEFEKSSKDVRDLFLQVLDEGFFSDMHGRKVNARNLIIIVTSNAASDVIWETVRKGESLAEKHDEIIDSIIKSEVFRPELLNRFDGVIIFHPLLEEHLREVARLQLGKFAARLEEKGIIFKTTPELLDYLIKIGSKDTFGGRAMNRALADTIEQIVARKIIDGTARAGVELIIGREELEAASIK
jgi:ATP-dependent Clp protease ATP-binding subunit ClpC